LTEAAQLDVWFFPEHKQDFRAFHQLLPDWGSAMKKLLSVVILLTATAAVADDTMQKAGKQVDKAASDTADATSKAAKDTSKATKKAATDTSNATKKAVSSGAEATGKAASKTGDALKKTANDAAPAK